MHLQPLYHTWKRYRTLSSHTISALPIVILMPHSACNCRCVMCDIWKDNRNLKQLTEQDINGLLGSLSKLGTRRVVMSGGEALLNPNFFNLCRILKAQGMKITLLSTGLSIERNTVNLLSLVDDLIVSLDGDEVLHDKIRGIPQAFSRLRDGVRHIKSIRSKYRITGRAVIHRLNFRNWPNIIRAAKDMGLDQISFLPADVSSHAFNRQTAWSEPKQHEVLLSETELPELQAMIDDLLIEFKNEFKSGFIAEPPMKIQAIYDYYAAYYGRNLFPYKRCNAPWVSTVIEADGSVRPCFFLDTIGNIRNEDLSDILNSPQAISFRKGLDMDKHPTCVKCVCSLNLPPLMDPAAN